MPPVERQASARCTDWDAAATNNKSEAAKNSPPPSSEIEPACRESGATDDETMFRARAVRLPSRAPAPTKPAQRNPAACALGSGGAPSLPPPMLCCRRNPSAFPTPPRRRASPISRDPAGEQPEKKRCTAVVINVHRLKKRARG